MAQSDTILIKDLPQELISAVGGVAAPVEPVDDMVSGIDERAQVVGAVEVPKAVASAEDTLVGMPFGEPFAEVYKQLRETHGTNILEHAEREIIKRTLEDVDGKQVKAAEILGMTRATLRKRIDQYDLK